MAKNRTLQLYRGTSAQNDAYTGSAGELTMDTTNNEVRLHDGSTAGGHKLAMDSAVVHLAGTETITGDKTFSGSSTFSGTSSFSGAATFSGDATFSDDVDLGAKATATTPAQVNDNSTKVATTEWVTNHQYSYATNCITEIPQDIKLELSAGTLTLKAGSKVYVPNGAGVFDTVTTTSDLTVTRTDSQDCMVWYTPSGNNINIFPKALFFSGATAPTAYTFMYWYDTTNNICKITTNQGSTWSNAVSFPVCIVSTDGTKISAIKQVFNGFGYVAGATFFLPGVSFLIPDGRNTDGTLKNYPAKISSVQVSTDSNPYKIIVYAGTVMSFANYAEQETQPAFTDGLWYNPVTNDTRSITSGVVGANRYYGKLVAVVEYSGGNIVSLKHPQTFRAVDYNDTSVDFVVASQLPTSANNYTWYRKYKSGWVEQGGYVAATGSSDSSKSVTLPIVMADGNYQVSKTISKGASNSSGLGWDFVADKSSAGTANTTTNVYLSVPSTSYCFGLWWKVTGMAA